MNEVEERAKTLWGADLHNNKYTPAHSPQLEEVFKEKWGNSLKGNLLEIGCGSGADLEIFSRLSTINTITAIDIGQNVDELSKKYKDNKNIEVLRGNALSLDFEKNRFDVIFSFGVFHHTSDPYKCITEAYRVLKNGGTIFLYLYSSHEDMLFKRIGILIEKIIMKFFIYIPYKVQNFICFLMSPICWVFFTLPSQILKLLRLRSLSKKMPFYFGTHPFSLIGDIKDRLMAPVNHRFSKKQISFLMNQANFSSIEIVKNASGLYINAKK